jgi:AraC-like DNA-binding protein
VALSPADGAEAAVPVADRDAPATLDVSVPYDSPRREEILRREWDRQTGGLIPLPGLTFPSAAAGPFRIRLRYAQVGSIGVEEQYTDAVAGISGGSSGHFSGRVVTHVTRQGNWHFSSPRDDIVVPPGFVCVRNNDLPWKFAVGHGTKALALGIPAEELRRAVGDRAIVVPQSAPEARLLIGYVDVLRGAHRQLGQAGLDAALNAMSELFAGLLSRRVVDDPVFSTALLKVARETVEARLLDPDLDPRSLAAVLNVSVRTLYRAFAAADMSVMAYVRSRRLERAHHELTSSGGQMSVSEAAARWHFADSSHFIRAFKRLYGETPAESARRGIPSSRRTRG